MPADARRSSVRIMGVDPGTQVAGYGLIETATGGARWIAHGAIKAPRKTDFGKRLLYLADRLEELIRVHKPDEIAVEKAFFGRSIKSAFTMGEGRGVIILTAARQGVPYFEYDPTQIKKSATGNGRAPKSQVQRAVRQHLRLAKVPSPSDAADALAIALCHATFRRRIILKRNLDTGGKRRHNRGK
ncbi:MAG: crossover junction endodeoxyribonuclease RuvC [Planctomycetota bacterium]|jgi:crossover junction endodeoxyribonuclease RuvC